MYNLSLLFQINNLAILFIIFLVFNVLFNSFDSILLDNTILIILSLFGLKFFRLVFLLRIIFHEIFKWFNILFISEFIQSLINIWFSDSLPFVLSTYVICSKNCYKEKKITLKTSIVQRGHPSMKRLSSHPYWS